MGRWIILVVLLVLILQSCSRYVEVGYEFGVVIPLYVYPSSDETNYNELLKFSPRNEVFIILNPMNGPGITKDTNYENAIKSLRERGYLILGYVYSSYASRDINEIKNDILRWLEFYTIDGIFIDEVSTSMSNFGYYSNIYEFIKGNSKKVVLNPGILVTKEFSDISDIVVIGEVNESFFLNSWSNNYELPSLKKFATYI